MGFPENLSTTAHHIDNLFWLATWLVLGSFAIVVGILGYCVVRFRARPGHRAVYAKGDSRRSTILTLIFAAAVFIFLDVNLAYFDFHAYEEVLGHEPSEDEALVIEVRGQQFEWHFRYPGEDGIFGARDDALVDLKENQFGRDMDDPDGQDDLTSLGEVAIPAGTPVIFKITSNDVLHSFFLPNFRVKMDALPGTMTRMHITARNEEDLLGDYEIACAELCGLQHYKMRGVIKVLSQEDYDAWIADLTDYMLADDEGY